MTQQSVETFFHEEKNTNMGVIVISQTLSFIFNNSTKIQECQVTLYDHSYAQFTINSKNFSLNKNAKIQPRYVTLQKKEGIVDTLVIHVDQNMVQLQTKDKCFLTKLYTKLKLINSHKGFNDYFQPLKRLGRGSFAAVYLIQSKATGDKFAAKVFAKEGQKLQYKGRQALENEIKTIKLLDHPNIIRFEGIYETDNLIYLVTEYLSGGTLVDFLRNNVSALGDHIVKIISDVLDALNYLRSKHIMHRDIKPENIVLRKQDNKWVLVDFGLAAYSNEVYLYNKCGTMGYIAPQIMENNQKSCPYTEACDMYSFGIVCYELIVGCLPFKVEMENMYDSKVTWEGLTKKQCAELDPQIVVFLKGLLQVQVEKRWIPQIAKKSAFLNNPQIVNNWKKYSDKLKKDQYENVFKPRN